MGKLHWENLTKGERAEYMRLQMSPSWGGGSAYYPDDCSECGACGTPTLGGGWCRSCLARHIKLEDKLRRNND